MKQRYRIEISFDKDCEENEIIGELFSPENVSLALIVLHSATVKKYNQREIFTMVIESTPVVFVTKEKHRKIQTKSESDVFSLYHELGHVALGHLSGTIKKPAKTRSQFIEENTVHPFETEADTFAAEQYGYKRAISALQTLLRERHEWNQRVNIFSKTNMNAIKEVSLRLQNLNAQYIARLESQRNFHKN